MLAVTILGNNSALPAFGRHPTSQVVTLNEHLFLVDCGEGTQVQIAKYKIRRSRLHHIFISHLHGDHYFGLMGLITSMSLLGREQDLHICGPEPLMQIIQLQLQAGAANLPFFIHFHPLDEGMLVKTDKYEISCFKVFHRIDCWGFIFREIKPPRKINGVNIRLYNIPVRFYEALRWGKDFVASDGSTVPNEAVTDPAVKGRSYAFAADTMFEESVAGKVKGVDLLYHETTYLEEMSDQAMKRFHSTTVQAGTIARMADVSRLLIGHFSSKYEDLSKFEAETRTVFANSDLAIEGVTYRA